MHNDARVEGKGRSVQRPRKGLKFERSHGSPVTIFSLYNPTNGDSTKDEKKEKSQYQDTICSEAEEGNGDRP